MSNLRCFTDAQLTHSLTYTPTHLATHPSTQSIYIVSKLSKFYLFAAAKVLHVIDDKLNITSSAGALTLSF